MTDSPPDILPSNERFIDRLETFALGREKTGDRKQNRAQQAAPIRRSTGLGPRLLPLLSSAAFIVLFVYATNYYASTRQRTETAPHVVNLTKAGLASHIAFGPSPVCGDHPCWVEPGFDDRAWTTAVLPLRPDGNIRALPGYPKDHVDHHMFYRIKIPIPQDLIDLPDEISFSPMYLQHKFFATYLNGRLIFTGNGVKQSQAANFPIPKSDILNGAVTFVIEASAAEEDLGITARGSMLLGPKTILDSIYVHNERALYTYYLLFLLTKGSIFVIFTLFFCFTRGQPGLAYFLVFAFFDAAENFFIGEYLAGDVPLSIRTVAYFTCKAIAAAGLLSFFMTFYRATRLKTGIKYVSIAAILGVFLLAVNLSWLTKAVTFSTLFMATNTLLVAAIMFGIGIGLLSSRRWRKRKVTGRQLQNFERFTGVLVIYLGLIIWEFYFKDYGGFDKRAVFDLGLFIWLALTTAMDMGLQEGKIKTLEGHMEEKRRMELELQEAAEIARAFFPQTAPTWLPYTIRTFHRPLTENSGDWYAFEASPSGKLFHFLMCDITGHGVQAAIVVSTCKSVLSSFVHTNPEKVEDPQFIVHFVNDLNATLFRNGAGNHVSTLLGITFEPEAETIHFISAGHPSPLFISRPGDANFRPQALISRNNVLGINPEFTATMKSHEFRPGDHLLTFTDGLPVGSNVKALRTFLEQTLGPGPVRDSAPEELFKRIWEAETTRTSLKPNDDVSIVWFSAVA